MPELPEVEVVRQGLQDWAVGKVISQVRVLDPRSIKGFPGTAEDFSTQLSGATIAGARRRGKFLWLPLADTHEALNIHLGMV